MIPYVSHFVIFGDSFFNTEVAGSREVFYVFVQQNDTLSRIIDRYPNVALAH